MEIVGLKEAVTLFARDRHGVARYLELGGVKRDNASLEDRVIHDTAAFAESFEQAGLTCDLIEDLLQQLRTGLLQCRGYRLGTFQSVEIPAVWWQDANINWIEKCAHAHREVLYGLQFYRPIDRDVSARQPEVPAKRPPKPDQKLLNDAFLEFAKKDGWKRKRSADPEGKAFLEKAGATSRQMIKAYQSLVPRKLACGRGKPGK
jgi:hypothetical protein